MLVLPRHTTVIELDFIGAFGGNGCREATGNLMAGDARGWHLSATGEKNDIQREVQKAYKYGPLVVGVFEIPICASADQWILHDTSLEQ